MDENPLDGNPTCDLCSACLPLEPLFSFSGNISPKIEIKNSKKSDFKGFQSIKVSVKKGKFSTFIYFLYIF
jgi:hypothetical protein